MLKSVGSFFGVGESSAENTKKLKDKAEKNIQEKQFGLKLNKSQQSKSQGKFIHDAEKMLSRIDTFQKLEEKGDTRVDDEVESEPRPLEESHPGTSTTSYINELKRTLSQQSGSSTKQWAINETYDIDDEPNRDHKLKNTDATDVDTSANKQSVTKSKVRFENEDEKNDQTSDVDDVKSVSKIYSTNDWYGKKSTDLPYPGNYKSVNEINQASGMVEGVDKEHTKPKIIFFDEISAKSKQFLESIPGKILVKFGGNHAKDKADTETTALEKETVESMSSSKDKVIEKSELKEVEDGKITGGTDKEASESAEVPGDDENKTIAEKVSGNFGPEDFVYGRVALQHYNLYTKIEKKVEKQKLQEAMEMKLAEYDWKINAIDEMIALAKDYYVNPGSRNAEKWRALKKNVKRSSSHQIGRTEVRRKLGTLPDYRPLFTYFIIVAQLISFIVTCALAGFTYIGVEPQLTLQSDVQTFIGMETVHKWTAPNVWIGPDQRQMIGFGSMYAPCMRQDISIQLMYSQFNYSVEAVLGCCEISARNVAGTTTEQECDQLTKGVGSWRSGVPCGSRAPGDASVRHILRPCCVGLKGQCRLVTHKHCMFLHGVYHLHGPEHCFQVNCLKEVCKQGSLTGSSVQPWMPDKPHQWWRLFLSLLYHHGIIHVVIVTVAELVLLKQIEQTAGWLRMVIVYLMSGTASLLASASFSPFEAHVGGVGAVCGMLGVVLVELMQFWSVVQSPCTELVKLLLAITLLLFCGMLPYLNIFGMLTGLVVGALCGVILLPYITFGKWHVPVRIVLIVMATALLLGIFYMLVHVFVKVQSLDGCKICKLIECVPYTEKMCDSKLWQEY